MKPIDTVLAPILVINPNSTEEVTRGIDGALEPLRVEGGPPIECATLQEGPPGIESQADADGVVGPLCRLIRARDESASAFVIACYSDPGLHAARETTEKPVLGIAESAMITALSLGERFGIVSILRSSLPRHRRAIRAAGLSSRFAGDVPLDLGVVELADEARTLDRMLAAGRALCDQHHADVVILGCAGMARYRKRLQQALSVPVIDPTQAAVTLAIGRVLLDAP